MSMNETRAAPRKGLAVVPPTSIWTPLVLAAACFFAGWCLARDGLVEGLHLGPGGFLVFDAAYRNLWSGLAVIGSAWVFWIVARARRGRN